MVRCKKQYSLKNNRLQTLVFIDIILYLISQKSVAAEKEDLH